MQHSLLVPRPVVLVRAGLHDLAEVRKDLLLAIDALDEAVHFSVALRCNVLYYESHVASTRLHTCTLQRTRPLCAQRERHADAANAACSGARCEVAGVSPVSAQMWQGCAQSRRRCGRGAHGAKCSPYTATHPQSVKTWATLCHEAKPVPQGTTGYYRVLQRTRSRF
jgi:hypothetical protein